MRERLLARVRMQDDLRDSIDRSESVVHYQPIVELATGAVTDVEALVRWCRGSLGVVPPDAFIAVAEEAGLITAFFRSVLTTACADAARWNAQRPASQPIGITVNLSVHRLGDADLVGLIRSTIGAAGLHDSGRALQRLGEEPAEARQPIRARADPEHDGSRSSDEEQ